MAPHEVTILKNYLLLPAHLPTIVSLQEFTSYFPKSQQSSPQIRALYRDLQQQRSAVVDAVAGNIDSEVRRGRALRRAIAKARREANPDEGVDDEIEIERNVSWWQRHKPLSAYRPYSCTSIMLHCADITFATALRTYLEHNST
jgi:centromere-localized protein 2